MEREPAENTHSEELRRLSSVLSAMSGFARKHNNINYIDFDYYVIHDLTLFAMQPDFDFWMLQQTLSKISRVLPAMKRIFSKPIINLKDIDDVLPVENVRVINQDTMSHLAGHSENVADITDAGVLPRRLLTRTYEDDYGIYENIVFCNFVDEILGYARRNLRDLRDFVYASEILEINLLERLNHRDYFMAVGKLHNSYIRDFDRYYGISKAIYGKLTMLSNAIQSRLKKPVYRENRVRNRDLGIKKTNIFLMQKDYHQVYLAYRYMVSNKLVERRDEEDKPDIDTLRIDYFDFLQFLTVFATGHFGFESDPHAKMDFMSLDYTMTFMKWTIRITDEDNKCLLLTISKDKAYRILLTPQLDNDCDESVGSIAKDNAADEIVFCTPFEDDAGKDRIFISVESIESFRRLQQLILRGMVYSDEQRDDCPFCGGRLSFNGSDGSYECESCRTQIRKGLCRKTGKGFFYTTISHLKKHTVSRSEFSQDAQWLYRRRVEASMYFRNITEINGDGGIICPFCGCEYQRKN